MENAAVTEVPAKTEDGKFSLEQVIPEQAKLTINGKEYTLRKITLADEAWLKAQGQVEKLFESEDSEFFAKLAFRLIEDKSDFPGEIIKTVDDDGFPIEKRITGPQKVLAGLSGPTQKYELLKALCQTLGISRPLFDKIVEENLKKNGMSPEESKTLVTQLTGEKSST